MKKTLAVILAVVMVFMYIPFLSIADTVYDEEVFLYQEDLETLSFALASGKLYTAAGNLTVPPETTLIIGSGAKLVIPDGKTLTISPFNGNVVVQPAGELVIDGKVTNADKISGAGTYTTKITFPALSEFGLNGKIEVSYACSVSGNAYDNLTGTLTFYSVSDDGGSVYVPLNQYLYIIAHIIEPVEGLDQFDDSLVTVRLNGVPIDYTQGDHHTLITTGGDISYSTWVNDDYYLTTCKIDLPVKDGVTVIGREGEMSEDGEIIYIKFGKPFSFRVDIDEEYSKSPYKVYIVSGYGWTSLDTDVIMADLTPAVPDEDGYYTIPEVKSDYTVFVEGVIANQTIDKVSGIFEQVKSIFEMIRKFFAQILELFGVSV